MHGSIPSVNKWFRYFVTQTDLQIQVKGCLNAKKNEERAY